MQPYVVERTGAAQLHAEGITGRGVTIAFLDTGYWRKPELQKNVSGRDVLFQGYDAISGTTGTHAPYDEYGHGT
ncbi:MAG: alkaline serine protease, partial [Gammaproteobacteria bacterium]|nr:alkaline serine protease [Gammaproteobacteria bacterium]